MDKERLLNKLLVLADAYANFTPKKNTYNIYIEMLSDLDEELLDKSIRICISTCRFFPTIADIRDNAVNILMSNIPGALQAWDNVKKEIGRVGFNGEPKFDNSITDKVVKYMGWSYICRSTEHDNRITFTKLYDKFYNDFKLMPITNLYIESKIKLLT